MKKITITDLKAVSKVWCETKEKLIKDDEIFLISSDIIIDNLKYEVMDRMIALLKRETGYYYDLFKLMKSEGWDIKWPGTIAIGDNKEIFIHGGNHRVNMLTLLEVSEVPFSFVYMKDIKPSPTAHKLLTTSESFYPKGLLPKWELNK